jgi:N-methylhydantoinase B
VLDDAGVIDEPATTSLRDEIRSGRDGELPVFDMGAPIADLLERCEEETGLPAPKPPVWL